MPVYSEHGELMNTAYRCTGGCRRTVTDVIGRDETGVLCAWCQAGHCCSGNIWMSAHTWWWCKDLPPEQTPKHMEAAW